MDPIIEVLHGLIEAVAHLMPPGRAGELHDLASTIGTAAGEVAEAADAIAGDTAPPA